MGFPGNSEVKASACNAGRPGFDPWVRKIPLEKKMATHSSIVAWKFHGQRSLAGYSPWDHKSWTRLIVTKASPSPVLILSTLRSH